MGVSNQLNEREVGHILAADYILYVGRPIANYMIFLSSVTNLLDQVSVGAEERNYRIEDLEEDTMYRYMYICRLSTKHWVTISVL